MMKDNKGQKQEIHAYRVVGKLDQIVLPSWSRRPRKWQQLIDMVNQLEPGQTLVIEFPTVSIAERARNVVRDELNRQIGRAAIRTRVVAKEEVAEDGAEAEVYFTRLLPLDIVEDDE